MYYISVELEDDVNEKDAQEVLESIRSFPEVSQATMVKDDGAKSGAKWKAIAECLSLEDEDE